MPGSFEGSPRFPQVDRGAGHYESFYLKAVHPDMPVGVWIRYTVHKAPGAGPNGSLWFTLFERGRRPRAVKATHGEVAAGEGRYIEVGESSFAPRRVTGSAEGGGHRATWELELDPLEAPVRHLPRDWMYRAPLPRTKLLSPCPYARLAGTVEYDGHALALDGWRGMVGHNWGAQHAERWIWVHAAGFAEDEGAWLDLALGRVRLGPLTTPWVANGILHLEGERERIGGLAGTRITEVRERPEGCEFVVPGGGLTVQGRIAAAREDFVGWIYADPDGSEHNAVNCSVADMTLSVSRPGQAPVSLGVDGGATYELGMRETDHGMRIEPFSDG